MRGKGPERTVCQDRLRKGVTLRLRSNGEDHYECRYCDFYFFTVGSSRLDREASARWRKVNGLREGE